MRHYDPEENSYVVNVTKEQLQSAPADSVAALTRNDGRAYRDSAYSYYDTARYWHTLWFHTHPLIHLFLRLHASVDDAHVFLADHLDDGSRNTNDAAAATADE